MGIDHRDQVGEFTQAFAASIGAPYGVSVVNGTVALFLALRALGVGRDDEVIVPAYTFVASATAVVLAGARPVIADVTPETLHLDPAAVERLIGPRTKAIMPGCIWPAARRMSMRCKGSAYRSSRMLRRRMGRCGGIGRLGRSGMRRASASSPARR